MPKVTYKNRPYLTTEKQRQKQKEYYRKHRKTILEKQRAYYTPDRAEYQKHLRFSRKKQVYDHYGRQCNCCGEMNELFLSIDHKNNDGNIERKAHGGGRSDTIIHSIIRQDFPDSYQILCMNCNTGKARNGGVCPHLLS